MRWTKVSYNSHLYPESKMMWTKVSCNSHLYPEPKMMWTKVSYNSQLSPEHPTVYSLRVEGCLNRVYNHKNKLLVAFHRAIWLTAEVSALLSALPGSSRRTLSRSSSVFWRNQGCTLMSCFLGVFLQALNDLLTQLHSWAVFWRRWMATEFLL